MTLCAIQLVAQSARTDEADIPYAVLYQRMLKGMTSVDGNSNLSFASDAGGESKSRNLGILYSMLLPGMGELYAGRFDRGVYPFATEAALWLGLLGVNSYGNWISRDARMYAVQHSGIDPVGKDDEFFVNIENYSDLYDYNNQRLVERRIDDVYPDIPAYRWSWDSDENRMYYKDRRILSDKMHNAVSFFILGMIANRIWSAIQAGMFVRDHNERLQSAILLFPSMRPELIARYGKTDELRFVFSW